MIVGIDETGDFREGSRAWLVAVLVRPASLTTIEAALTTWERQTRRRLSLSNEIKGSQIDTAAAESFVHDVVEAGDGASVFWTAQAVDFDAANRASMAVQRRILSDGYTAWADMQVGSDDPQRKKFERVLRHWADWVRARDDREMLKLATLANLLPLTVEWSFGRSIAGGYDEELGELSIRVDRGYVSQSEMVIWRDIVRNVFYERTSLRPIPFSDQWEPDHPVLEAFVEKHLGGTTFQLRPSFKERIDFYDSATTPMVRIADVVAAIVRGGESGGSLRVARQLLKPHHFDSFPYTVLQWTDQPRAAIPNPWTTLK